MFFLLYSPMPPNVSHAVYFHHERNKVYQKQLPNMFTPAELAALGRGCGGTVWNTRTERGALVFHWDGKRAPCAAHSVWE